MSVDDRMRRAAREVRRAMVDVTPRRPLAHRPNVSSVVVFASAFLAALLTIGIAALAFRQGDTEVPGRGNEPVAGTSEPTATVLGEMAVTFPNGLRGLLRYPLDLRLDRMPRRVSLTLRVADGPDQGCGVLLELANADPTDPSSPVLQVIELPNGRTATLRQPADHPAAQVMVMDLDDWQLVVPFSAEDACDVGRIAPALARSIDATNTGDGFIHITAARPFELDPVTTGVHGTPQVTLSERGNTVTFTPSSCSDADVMQLDILPPALERCTAGGQVRMFAQGDDSFLDAVASNLFLTVDDAE